MKKFVGLVAASALFVSSTAMAATISDVSGKVLVNKGEGFVAAAAGESLKAGDKVMVGENSFAVVAYDECAVSLSKPTVLTVAKAPACGAEAETVISPVADIDSGYDAAPIIPLPLILLGVAGAGVGIAIAAGVLDDDNSPASAP